MNTTCKICNRQFKTIRSLGSHTTQYHKISKEKYYLKYINSSVGLCKNCNAPTKFNSLSKGYSRCCGPKCAKLLDSLDIEYRKKISVATKAAMWRPDIREKYIKSREIPLSIETRRMMSVKAKSRCTKVWKDNLYTSSRNKKVSISKIDYWKNNPEKREHVGKLWELWKQKDEIGWRRHLQMASKLGFEKIFGNHGETSLETKMYKFLADNNINFQRQYELEWKFYDAYLPDYNILLEFDGDFWHKNSLEECQYPFQVSSYHNDIQKNNIAKKHNIVLFRLREHDSPEKIFEYIGVNK